MTAQSTNSLSFQADAIYGPMFADSHLAERTSDIPVIDGEPMCIPGAEVRVARAYDWEGLQHYRCVGAFSYVRVPACGGDTSLFCDCKRVMGAHGCSQIWFVSMRLPFAIEFRH